MTAENVSNNDNTLAASKLVLAPLDSSRELNCEQENENENKSESVDEENGHEKIERRMNEIENLSNVLRDESAKTQKLKENISEKLHG